jgi:DNA-binding IclR family transcriptional regulator
MEFLRAMAQDDGVSAIADVRRRLGASHATAQQYRARLIAAGLVAPERRGELSFTLPYLGEYLQGPAEVSFHYDARL